MPNSVTNQLRRMGWSPDVIASATVNGKPLTEAIAIAKPKHSDGMNKWERLFAADLAALQREGVVACWYFEAVKLRLARKTFYTPDFLIVYADGRLRFVEIKGHLRDDAAVKFKLAREKFAFAEWSMLTIKGGHFVPMNI